MKKTILLCLCVIFLAPLFLLGACFSTNNFSTFALDTQNVYNEEIVFNYHNRIFNYNLKNNIKTSNQFDLVYEINKLKRFNSKEDRINILNQLNKIGLEKSVALNYIFPNLNKTLNSIEKNINIKPKDATLNINSSTEKVFTVTPETIGIELDKNKLIEEIYSKYTTNEQLIFNLPTKVLQPKLTKTDFKHTHLRADFSTSILNSTLDRKHNIKNALNTLNKVEIAPNQIFSFNKTVGRRTAENGYRQAKIIINNEFVDGLGGGVCQVSSTLYNAVLLAGLEIVEANKHSKQVAYVKQGFDAMVNFGSSDLKFKNNTNEKITIITNYNSNTARIRIFGENKNGVQYKLTNEILNIVEPTEEVFVDEKQEYLDKVKFEDEYFYLKKATKGMEIKSYREKYVNNLLISKELLRHDKFKVQNAVKVYGNVKREESSSFEQFIKTFN